MKVLGGEGRTVERGMLVGEPRPGDFWIVTNGGDDPQCIIQTSDVRVLPFGEVGGEYAQWGGEGVHRPRVSLDT